MKVSPVAPKLSNKVSQYSPAPVVKTRPMLKQVTATQATRMGFLTCLRLGWSNRVDTTPSRIPIWDPRPKDSNIMKNRADQNGAPGILVNTSAITMKAKPVPWAESSSSLTREQFLIKSTWSGCFLQMKTVKDVASGKPQFVITEWSQWELIGSLQQECHQWSYWPELDSHWTSDSDHCKVKHL